MAFENIPASIQSDGNWRITNVPSGSNAKSVAILNGATAKAITYGLTADGYTSEITQATVPDARLTLRQDLSRPGKVTATAGFKAVASTTVDSADQVLKALSLSGVESQFLVRRGVANDAAHAVAQVGDLLTGIVGVRRPTPPTENGVDTAEYALFLTKPIEEVTLVA
jgi:hypothetical protein